MSVITSTPSGIEVSQVPDGFRAPLISNAGYYRPIPDVVDRGYYYLQSKIGITNPLFTRWIMGEYTRLGLAVAGGFSTGIEGGIALATPSGANASMDLYPFPAANQVGYQNVAGSTGVWGWLTRFSIRTDPSLTSRLGPMLSQASGGACMSLGAYPAVTPTGFVFGFDSTFVDTGIILDKNIHTAYVYRDGVRSYLEMDNCVAGGVSYGTGIFYSAFPAGATSYYPTAPGALRCFVGNGGSGTIQAAGFYVNSALTPAT